MNPVRPHVFLQSVGALLGGTGLCLQKFAPLLRFGERRAPSPCFSSPVHLTYRRPTSAQA